MPLFLRKAFWHGLLAVGRAYCGLVLALSAVLGLVWPKAKRLVRRHILASVGMRSVARGDVMKARDYAEELLEFAADDVDHWDYGNVVHKGNLILGRAALRVGNIKAAKDYLLRAGKTPGSPQLDSFGPNMILAKELLEAGEVQTVIEYYVLCGKFWKIGSEHLKHWTAVTLQGRVPNFGPNLVY